ncbi:MAG: cupin domain-containing protein [Chitinispirillales bacterium]|jgi:predicted cupin superfamily sugar epimerase|nr:cupin domain-containing protein [Chitinispirillales bacterium]
MNKTDDLQNAWMKLSSIIKADELIQMLGLEPHPEGGHYRETFRDEDCDANGRAFSTAIYFLLRAGEKSWKHCIDAAEIWHWYSGAPLLLRVEQNGKVEEFILGPDIAAGHRPQIIVHKHVWQSAHTLGEYTLLGCTVAPGFMFEHFELAEEG